MVRLDISTDSAGFQIERFIDSDAWFTAPLISAFETPSKIRNHIKQSFSQENERLRKRKALHQEALTTLVGCNRLPEKIKRDFRK